MRDEEGEGQKTDSELSKARAQIEGPPEDEDEKVTELF
jgi:hypothetical protein